MYFTKCYALIIKLIPLKNVLERLLLKIIEVSHIFISNYSFLIEARTKADSTKLHCF
jgi:hypothetical protein